MNNLTPQQQQALALSQTPELAAIPPRTLQLLYISDDPRPPPPYQPLFTISLDWYTGTVQCEVPPLIEPSTIFTSLPVARPRDPAQVPRPDYSPSYTRLTPDQRWIYLTWLCNVSAPIDIGYVFLYYYGLERQLWLGDYDQAKAELELLINSHSHRSFRRYAQTALFSGSIVRQRASEIEEVFAASPPATIEDIHLLAAHRLSIDLNPLFFMAMARNIRRANRRYIELHPERFSASLSALFLAKYGIQAYPLSQIWKLEDLPRARNVLFANSSFPENMRSDSMPSFFRHPPFHDEVSLLLAVAHESTKQELSEARRSTNRSA